MQSVECMHIIYLDTNIPTMIHGKQQEQHRVDWPGRSRRGSRSPWPPRQTSCSASGSLPRIGSRHNQYVLNHVQTCHKYYILHHTCSEIMRVLGGWANLGFYYWKEEGRVNLNLQIFPFSRLFFCFSLNSFFSGLWGWQLAM